MRQSAAINYHFGDKVGLYLAVLSSSFCMREHELAREALSVGGTPEERFRHFVRMFCQRMFDPERPSAEALQHWQERNDLARRR